MARRRFHIRSYGCQMNAHDSEKVANLLHHAGFERAASEPDADLVVVNTCSIREKAEHRLYTDLGILRLWKAERPGRLIGVGGCVAQQEGDSLLRRYPQIDFAFGTHTVRWVPDMVAAAERGQREARFAEDLSLARFDLPQRHPAYDSETPGRAWLTVMEGCDLFCSYCVVPITRGREISRPAEAIVAEARGLAAAGVRELTLLGQTVNAYGRHDVRRGRTAAAGTLAFAELLAALAEIPGIERLRYTSPHPLFFDEALVRAHAEIPELCPHVHLPVQSGSDRVLAAMRRRYTAREYLAIVAALRRVRPDVALTSDFIVGHPGETRADFEATLALIREVGFVDSFSFKYSARPGTTSAGLGETVSPEESQERLSELQALQRDLTFAAHRARVGERVTVFVEGASRRGAAGADGLPLQGRDPQHRVVNFRAPADSAPEPGSFIELAIVEATPHSLIGSLAREALAVNPLRRAAEEPLRAAV
jgi:tRNA-2-methylthio-N6-dimethylallyladenosine synthase